MNAYIYIIKVPIKKETLSEMYVSEESAAHIYNIESLFSEN